VLARAFGITPHHVSKIHSTARKVQKPPHPPVALPEDQERSVLQFIQSGFMSGNDVTYREILNLVEERFQKTVTYGWLASFLDLRQDSLIRTVVKPHE
jgi:hypothetical protein